jgi:hypothetical protein
MPSALPTATAAGCPEQARGLRQRAQRASTQMWATAGMGWAAAPATRCMAAALRARTTRRCLRPCACSRGLRRGGFCSWRFFACACGLLAAFVWLASIGPLIGRGTSECPSSFLLPGLRAALQGVGVGFDASADFDDAYDDQGALDVWDQGGWPVAAAAGATGKRTVVTPSSGGYGGTGRAAGGAGGGSTGGRASGGYGASYGGGGGAGAAPYSGTKRTVSMSDAAGGYGADAGGGYGGSAGGGYGGGAGGVYGGGAGGSYSGTKRTVTAVDSGAYGAAGAYEGGSTRRVVTGGGGGGGYSKPPHSRAQQDQSVYEDYSYNNGGGGYGSRSGGSGGRGYSGGGGGYNGGGYGGSGGYKRPRY